MIAPGQGKNTMNDLMQGLAPHARPGTTEDLEPAKGAFTGASRTLNGAPPVQPHSCQAVHTTSLPISAMTVSLPHLSAGLNTLVF